jgi:hypothetical protein
MGNLNLDQLNELCEQIKTKASLDSEFRTLCVENINKAVQELTGDTLPEDFIVDVVESEPDSDLTLVLPPMKSAALSDGELDNISGGVKKRARRRR